jgi:hypothetical protein
MYEFVNKVKWFSLHSGKACDKFNFPAKKRRNSGNGGDFAYPGSG